jgi:chromosome segregation ATPase
VLERHQAMTCHSNEHLSLKSAEAVDLASLCVELKDEVVATHGKVVPLQEEVRLLNERVVPLEEAAQSLRERVALLEEEVRRLKENLWAIIGERDESRRQATEAFLHADSLSRDLGAERSTVQGLRPQMGGKRCCLIFSIWAFQAMSQCFYPLLELEKDLDISIQTSQTLS